MPHIDINKQRSFCAEVVSFYPELEPNPRPIEYSFTNLHPSHTHPMDVMDTYLSMKRSELALRDPEYAATNPTWQGDFGFRNMRLSTLAKAKQHYEQLIADMPKDYPREGTALLASMAIHYDWELRELAARLMPKLKRVAPEVGVRLLGRLAQDPQDSPSRGIRCAAQESQKVFKDVPLRQDAPNIPYWVKRNWVPLEEQYWATNEQIVRILTKEGYDDRRIAGALRAMGRLTLRRLEPSFLAYHMMSAGPRPVARFAHGDYGDILRVEMNTVAASLRDNSHTGRAWQPRAVPLFTDRIFTVEFERDADEWVHVIRQNLAAVACVVNATLRLPKPIQIPEPQTSVTYKAIPNYPGSRIRLRV